MSGWTQLFFLFFFFILGQTLTLLFVKEVLHIDLTTDSVNLSLPDMWKMQTVFALLTFLTPALFCASLFHKKPEKFLAINKGFSIINLLLAIVVIFAAQPVVNIISEWNQQISLPESLSKIETSLKAMEENATLTTNRMLLSDMSVSALLINILVVALVAAIAEEFFFRGIIQSTIQKISNNIHIAVWITAIIFSFIHFQFYGFFPRILLGALLGYIFVWSRSLWVPIIIHFINNAAAILLYRQYHDDKNVIEFGTGETWWIALVGLVITIGVLFCMYKVDKNRNSLSDQP